MGDFEIVPSASPGTIQPQAVQYRSFIIPENAYTQPPPHNAIDMCRNVIWTLHSGFLKTPRPANDKGLLRISLRWVLFRAQPVISIRTLRATSPGRS